MRGLVAARAAVLPAIAAIDADMKKLVRASHACRRLMTIPGVGHLSALAFAAAVDDPERFRRSRDLGAYLGLVPRRYQSGEVEGLGVGHRQTVHPPEGAERHRPAARPPHTRHAPAWLVVQAGV